jgi:hypothetical protein
MEIQGELVKDPFVRVPRPPRPIGAKLSRNCLLRRGLATGS